MCIALTSVRLSIALVGCGDPSPSHFADCRLSSGSKESPGLVTPNESVQELVAFALTSSEMRLLVLVRLPSCSSVSRCGSELAFVKLFCQDMMHRGYLLCKFFAREAAIFFEQDTDMCDMILISRCNGRPDLAAFSTSTDPLEKNLCHFRTVSYEGQLPSKPSCRMVYISIGDLVRST